VGTAVGALMALGLAVERGAFPYLENTLHRRGLGPATLHDHRAYGDGLLAYDWVWWLPTALGVVGTAALGALVLRRPDRLVSRPSRAWVVLPALFLFAPQLIVEFFFDRYLIPVTPLFVVFAVVTFDRDRAPSPLRWTAAAGLLVVSMIGTRDYFAWSEARWRVALAAVDLGYRPEEVDAGFEWNAWSSYEQNQAVVRASKPLREIDEWDWLELNDFRAIVTASAHYSSNPDDLLTFVEYRTPLSYARRRIYLWRLRGP